MDAGQVIADFLALIDSAQKRYAAAMVEEQEANGSLIRTLGEIRRKRRRAKNDKEIADLILKFQDANAGVVKALQRLQGDIRTTAQHQARRDYQFRTEVMTPYLNENALADAGNIGQSGKES